jgi:catechol 2,3-dioxygenase-like lactoylglutathione lyase family enzyme
VPQVVAAVTVLVPDYDAGVDYYCGRLGFALVEDTPLDGDERWVRVRPAGGGAALRLARARADRERAAIGDQAAGRVLLFLQTDDLTRDHARYTAAGVRFTESPRAEAYGKVAVFEDAFGNRWDLIEPSARERR